MRALLGLLFAVGVAQASPPIALDAQGDRVLFGTPAPVEGAGDVGLRLAIELRVKGQPAPWRLTEAVEQARLLTDGRALVTTPQHALLEVDLATGATRALDTDVVGAVGASPDGRHLVYCRGEAPELEVWRLDRQGGAPQPVTTGMAPTWSPAIAEDGRVVFTSSRSGVPALWLAEPGQAPRQITNLGARFEPGRAPTLSPTPAALSPVVFGRGVIAFEAAGAVHLVDAAGRALRQVAGAAPHWITPGRALGVVVDGRVVRVPLGGTP